MAIDNEDIKDFITKHEIVYPDWRWTNENLNTTGSINARTGSFGANLTVTGSIGANNGSFVGHVLGSRANFQSYMLWYEGTLTSKLDARTDDSAEGFAIAKANGDMQFDLSSNAGNLQLKNRVAGRHNSYKSTDTAGNAHNFLNNANTIFTIDVSGNTWSAGSIVGSGLAISSNGSFAGTVTSNNFIGLGSIIVPVISGVNLNVGSVVGNIGSLTGSLVGDNFSFSGVGSINNLLYVGSILANGPGSFAGDIFVVNSYVGSSFGSVGSFLGEVFAGSVSVNGPGSFINNVFGGNVYSKANISGAGDIYGANIYSKDAGSFVGNVTAGSIISYAGSYSKSIETGSLISPGTGSFVGNLFVGNLYSKADISGTGIVYGGSAVVGNGSFINSIETGSIISPGTGSFVGNVFAGNFYSVGTGSFSGDSYAGSFIGNIGSFATVMKAGSIISVVGSISNEFYTGSLMTNGPGSFVGILYAGSVLANGPGSFAKNIFAINSYVGSSFADIGSFTGEMIAGSVSVNGPGSFLGNVYTGSLLANGPGSFAGLFYAGSVMANGPGSFNGLFYAGSTLINGPGSFFGNLYSGSHFINGPVSGTGLFEVGSLICTGTGSFAGSIYAPTPTFFGDFAVKDTAGSIIFHIDANQGTPGPVRVTVGNLPDSAAQVFSAISKPGDNAFITVKAGSNNENRGFAWGAKGITDDFDLYVPGGDTGKSLTLTPFNNGSFAINTHVSTYNLAPAADDTYNLGTAAAQWKDGLFDGTVYVDALSLGGLITPETNDLYDIGAAGTEMREVYTSGLTVKEITLTCGSNGETAVIWTGTYGGTRTDMNVAVDNTTAQYYNFYNGAGTLGIWATSCPLYLAAGTGIVTYRTDGTSSPHTFIGGFLKSSATYSNSIGNQRPCLMSGNGVFGYNASTIREKENIRLLGSESEFIYCFIPKVYDRKDKTGINEIGLIAEDVGSVAPQLLWYGVERILNPKYDPSNPKSHENQYIETGSMTNVIEGYDKDRLIIPMLAEVQKHQKAIKDLQTKTEELTKRLNEAGIK